MGEETRRDKNQENQEIKLVALDVDGTLVHYDKGYFGSSWDAISYALGVFDETQKMLRYYYPKKHLHCEWTYKQVGLFKGKKVIDAQRFLYPLPYAKGAKEFADKSKGKLVRGVLSTSLDIVAQKASEELELDFCLCNILGRENGVFTGDVDYKVPLWEKHLVLKDFCERKKVSLEEIAYVGDHENDIKCFEIVGLPIAFNPKKKEVADKVKYVISDFRELNEILGLN